MTDSTARVALREELRRLPGKNTASGAPQAQTLDACLDLPVDTRAQLSALRADAIVTLGGNNNPDVPLCANTDTAMRDVLTPGRARSLNTVYVTLARQASKSEHAVARGAAMLLALATGKRLIAVRQQLARLRGNEDARVAFTCSLSDGVLNDVASMAVAYAFLSPETMATVIAADMSFGLKRREAEVCSALYDGFIANRDPEGSGWVVHALELGLLDMRFDHLLVVIGDKQ